MTPSTRTVHQLMTNPVYSPWLTPPIVSNKVAAVGMQLVGLEALPPTPFPTFNRTISLLQNSLKEEPLLFMTASAFSQAVRILFPGTSPEQISRSFCSNFWVSLRSNPYETYMNNDLLEINQIASEKALELLSSLEREVTPIENRNLIKDYCQALINIPNIHPMTIKCFLADLSVRSNNLSLSHLEQVTQELDSDSEIELSDYDSN